MAWSRAAWSCGISLSSIRVGIPLDSLAMRCLPARGFLCPMKQPHARAPTLKIGTRDDLKQNTEYIRMELVLEFTPNVGHGSRVSGMTGSILTLWSIVQYATRRRQSGGAQIIQCDLALPRAPYQTHVAVQHLASSKCAQFEATSGVASCGKTALTLGFLCMRAAPCLTPCPPPRLPHATPAT